MTNNRVRMGIGALTTAPLAFVCGLSIIAQPAAGQLVPERLYYGVGRSAPMEVRAPETFSGEVSIALHEFGVEAPAARAPAAVGRVDLAMLFPMLWTRETPTVLYAQLELDGEGFGPPVVLQPLLTPNTAANVSAQNPLQPTFGKGVVAFEDERLARQFQAGLVESAERSVTYSGLRAYVDRLAVLDTTLGEMTFRLRPDAAPNTAFNFRQLVEGGFYTDIIFHRVVAQTPSGDPFVIQTGDPSGAGEGGPGYFVDLERSTLGHDFGVLSMARATDPNTNGSQIFVCLSREGTARLDGLYTSFAEAVAGADTIMAIGAVEVGESDRPVDPPVIRSGRLIDAPPFGEGAERVARPEPVPVSR